MTDLFNDLALRVQFLAVLSSVIQSFNLTLLSIAEYLIHELLEAKVNLSERLNFETTL